MASSSLWQRFQRYLLYYRDLDFSLDISRLKFPENFFEKMQPKIEKAFAAMRELEAGAIANPTENRMVGHYWLRNPALAPTAEIRTEIEENIQRIKKFAEDVHAGRITAENGKRFEHALRIGIGGSALGPQLVADALGSARDPMDIFFFDNTDPNGFDRVFDRIDALLPQTLVVVVSKSGGTKETRNGMLETEARFKDKQLPFNKHAVAVTGAGSDLDKYAEENKWLARFPMYDWIGGRTSVMSAVGLLPMALEGFDIDNFLAGAAAMDERTRVPDVTQNAAMLLALMWYYAGNGKGDKDMVILPYKDRLALFAKYLQQLVMESLGKEKDLDGNIVHQGIAVYGSLINVNAYDQPGVEAGKKAATRLLQLQKQVSEKLVVGEGMTAEEIARSIDADPEDVFHVLRHLASNDPHIRVAPGEEPSEDRFSVEQER